MAVSSTGASAEPEVPRDWLRKALETRVTVEGRARWQRFGPGSFVHFRRTAPDGRVSESRETLVAAEKGLAIRSERRAVGEEWQKSREAPLRVEAVPGA